MKTAMTAKEIEVGFGQQIKALRLRKNLHQIELAKQAGIALSALKNLEQGKGAALKTLIKTLRALDRTEWLQTISPTVSISPMELAKSRKYVRLRASPKRKARSGSNAL
jgi:transcriptional regulator with XRE-family HTH domain